MVETRGENCLAIVEDIVRLKFGINGNNIENAHRVGKYEGRPNQARDIIARFHSCMTRLDLFRTARAKLAQSGIRLVDDLTAADLKEKKRIQPYMNTLFAQDKRPSFRNGRLCVEKRPVPLEQIADFLASEEGKAATLAHTERR